MKDCILNKRCTILYPFKKQINNNQDKSRKNGWSYIDDYCRKRQERHQL